MFGPLCYYTNSISGYTESHLPRFTSPSPCKSGSKRKRGRMFVFPPEICFCLSVLGAGGRVPRMENFGQLFSERICFSQRKRTYCQNIYIYKKNTRRSSTFCENAGKLSTTLNLISSSSYPNQARQGIRSISRTFPICRHQSIRDGHIYKYQYRYHNDIFFTMISLYRYDIDTFHTLKPAYFQFLLVVEEWCCVWSCCTFVRQF